MNYRQVTIRDGSKRLGWWWYLCVELAFLVIAGNAVYKNDIMLAIVIFILIEIRDISSNIKGADNENKKEL
jgi:hypothetical protein